MPNILCPQRIPCCKFNKFAPRPSIISGAPTDPCLGVDYSFVFEAVGGTPPYTWSVALGNLPDGLTLTETGLLEGTPTVSGIFIFTIRLEDGACEVRGASYTVDVEMCEADIEIPGVLEEGGVPGGIVGEGGDTEIVIEE